MNRETHDTEKPKSRLLPFIFLIIIIALVVWQWPIINNQLVKTQQSIKNYFAEIDALGQKKRALMAEVAATQQLANKRLNEYEATLDESQKNQEALDATVNEFSQDPISDTLETIEQQIIFAILHLNVGGDINAALSAIQKAQTLVQEVDDEQLAPFKSSLKENIETLQTASSIDIKAMGSRVADLTDKIDSLPLASESSLTPVDINFLSRSTPPENGAWLNLFHEIWQDAKSFIHVKKVSDPEIELLSPSQAYFLRENLKLKFLLMRFSLLSGDINEFNTDLHAAISWINQYYNKEDTSVTNLLQALEQLHEDGSGFELPDIAESLDEIHNYRIKRNEEIK